MAPDRKEIDALPAKPTAMQPKHSEQAYLLELLPGGKPWPGILKMASFTFAHKTLHFILMFVDAL